MEGLLSLDLRELFEDRIPLRTSQTRGWRTRGYTLVPVPGYKTFVKSGNDAARSAS